MNGKYVNMHRQYFDLMQCFCFGLGIFDSRLLPCPYYYSYYFRLGTFNTAPTDLLLFILEHYYY